MIDFTITSIESIEMYDKVMEMVKSFLNLEKIPKPDDTADALALAVCHGHYSGTAYSRLWSENK